MARKYGFVNAADVKIGAIRGANFHSASLRGARANNNPMSTVSYPKMVHAGMDARGGVGLALSRGLTAGIARGSEKVQQAGQQRREAGAQQQQADRSAAMQQHPVMRSQGAVASRTGGNATGAVRERPGVVQPPAATSYYEAPVAMGANVPLSRQKKFAQGAGL